VLFTVAELCQPRVRSIALEHSIAQHRSHHSVAYIREKAIEANGGILDTERLLYLVGKASMMFLPSNASGKIYETSMKPTSMNPTGSSAASKQNFLSLEEAQQFINKELGVSPWLEITQARVDQFAEATGDFQFIHVDRERALAETNFGGTIAHGFLTLSLLSMLSAQSATIKIKDCPVSINYGLDKVRFMNPVKVGSRIRVRFSLLSVQEKSPGHFLIKHKAVVEIEGEDKPAMIAEWLGMSVK
jgi:acyl dehydratase